MLKNIQQVNILKEKLLNNAGEIRMMDILIKNAIIVTVNKEREVIFDGALVVKDNKIADIGNSKEIESKYTDVKNYRC